MKEQKINYKDYDIIRGMVVTEKSTQLKEKNDVLVLDVALKATKPDIKRAVESMFEVQVDTVNTLVRKGKTRVFKGHLGKRSGIKRAYVRLKSGEMDKALNAVDDHNEKSGE